MSPVDFLCQSTPINHVIYGFCTSQMQGGCVVRATHATPPFHLKLPVVGLFLLGMQPGVEDVVFNASCY